MIRLVRRLDPTRPISACSSYVRNREDSEKTLQPAGIDDGDIDDRHAYYGWYEDTHFKLFDGLWVRPGYGTTGINLDRPYISQECSTGYPDNDTGHPTRSYLFKHYTPQAFVGPWAYEDHDPMVFLRNARCVSKRWPRRFAGPAPRPTACSTSPTPAGTATSTTRIASSRIRSTRP